MTRISVGVLDPSSMFDDEVIFLQVQGPPSVLSCLFDAGIKPFQQLVVRDECKSTAIQIVVEILVVELVHLVSKSRLGLLGVLFELSTKIWCAHDG